MTQQAVYIDNLTAAAGRLAQGDAVGAVEVATDGLLNDPHDHGLLLVKAQGLISQGKTTAAKEALSQIETAQESADLISLRVEVALALHDLQEARSVIAHAEQHGAIATDEILGLKAQIAVADGDLVAARAILVMAVERYPHVSALRKQLTEILMAAGNAGDARSVLGHIAKPPVNPPAPSETLPDDHRSTANA